MRLLQFAMMVAMLVSTTAQAATIFIDTGHSAARSGAIAQDGTTEHSLNRAVALAVISELRKHGHAVRDVEAEGFNRTLASRVLDTEQADAFVSIHHDSIQQVFLDQGRAGEFAGHSVFVSGQARDLDGSLRCAIELGQAMLAAGSRPSHYHAAQIPGEGRPLLDAARGIHRYDGLAVLRHARAPAVLLEVGVMVNPRELATLRDPRWIGAAATQIARGIELCVTPDPA